jgi:hypothetical protein
MFLAVSAILVGRANGVWGVVNCRVHVEETTLDPVIDGVHVAMVADLMED